MAEVEVASGGYLPRPRYIGNLEKGRWPTTIS